MRLADLVEASSAVAATRSRTAKTETLAALLRGASGDEVPVVVAWLSGVLPQGRIGVGYATVGSLTVPPAGASTLTVADADGAFTAIAAESGPGSAQRREDRLARLFGAATEPEQRFLGSLLVGDLRQGALAGVMVEAIAMAAGAPGPAVRRAAMLGGELPEVARAALVDGAAALARFSVSPGRPVEPMLAQSAESVAAALERTGRASVEAKVDGARLQVHVVDGRVTAYTRNLRDVTGTVPELDRALGGLTGPAVLDGEVVALDDRGRPLPFQETMSRFGRDAATVAAGDQVPLVPRFFDCLHLEGRDLVDEPLEARWAALESAVPPELLLERVVTDDPDAAEGFFRATLAAGHEGVVVKAVASVYEAGRRGGSWIKVKPVFTLDLVVLAAEWGSGRRRGKLSNLHLGARDPAGGYVMLGKTFKGLTDDMLAWQTERLLELATVRDRRIVGVRPELVVEVAFDGVQESVRYPGGVALRFARVKGYRPDKSPGDADTIDTVRSIHRREIPPG